MKRTLEMGMLGLFAATALMGCMGPPVIEGESSEAATTAFANDKPAFDFFVAKGLTNVQAAGIVGNLDQESGVDPTIAQFGGGPGRGIAQWSTGGRWDTSANDNVVGYASKMGESATSLNLQLEFIWYELTTFGYGYTQLKAATTVTAATDAFMDYYEICGTCDASNRITYAQDVLNAYGVTPDWSAAFVSQTFPFASQPALTVKCGESVSAKIVLKNTGSKTWNSSTKIGTTQPRDRASIFAGSSWLAPNRAAAISGTVAPGANGTFTFAFDGPTGAACKPGTYKEYFGVVQESVAWFSDSGEGGPPDDQLEALIDLVPGDPGADMGGGGQTGGTGSDDGGTTSPGADGGTATGGGSTGGGGNGSTGGDVGGGGSGDNGQPPPSMATGCSFAVGAGGAESSTALALGLALIALGLGRARSLRRARARRV